MRGQSQFIEMFGKGNWEQKCLGEIGTFKRGGGFQKSDYVEHGIPCIHYGQIHTKFGPFIYSHITEISTDLEQKTKFASKGDLIIAITSEDTEGSCKSTAWLGDYPVAVGGHAAIFHHCMNPLYMSFFFKSTLFNYAKMEYIHGTKVFEVKPDDIAKILVPCPPMSLQKQFSVIARHADKSKFVGFKSQFIEMFHNDNFICEKLKAHIEVIRGVSYKPTDVRDAKDKDSSVILRSNNIFNGLINYDDIVFVDSTRVSEAQELSKGDIVMCGSNGSKNLVGKAAMITEAPLHKTSFGAFCLGIRCKDTIHPMYLSSYFQTSIYRNKIEELGTGSNILNIKPDYINNMEIPVPRIEQQLKFVSIAEQADKSKFELRKSIEAIDKVIKSLINN